MNSRLIKTSTKDMSRIQWLEFRIRGVGASDISSLFRMNQYKSEAQLFWEKLRMQPVLGVENIHTLRGKRDEDSIAEDWMYWDKTEEIMVQNYVNENKVRYCEKVNFYIENPDYPNLFVSLDRRIPKGEKGREGVLELKRISGYESDKWEGGIPMGFMLQLQTQIMVCMVTYGELCIRKDGLHAQVYSFDANPVIQAAIAEKVHIFWDKVKQGRILQNKIYDAESKYNFGLANQLRAELDMLEPEPEGTEAYSHFLTERYRNKPLDGNTGLITGTDADLQAAREYDKARQEIKRLEGEKRLQQNILLRRLEGNKKITFAESGYVSNIDNRFTVKIKNNDKATI